MTETSPIVATTSPVVMAFQGSLIEAKKFKRNGKESGEPKHSASFIFDPSSPDLARLKAAALSVASAKWPGRDIGADYRAGKFGLPFSNGNAAIENTKKSLTDKGKEYDGRADFMKDKIVLKASTGADYPPRLAVLEGNTISPVLQGPALAANKGKFYFGAEVLFEVIMSAYDAVGSNGTDGVTARLRQVLTTNKGKRLSGGGDPAETFAGYAGKLSAEDPTKGLDDEIAF